MDSRYLSINFKRVRVYISRLRNGAYLAAPHSENLMDNSELHAIAKGWNIDLNIESRSVFRIVEYIFEISLFQFGIILYERPPSAFEEGIGRSPKALVSADLIISYSVFGNLLCRVIFA